MLHINSLVWNFHLNKTPFPEIDCITSYKDPGIIRLLNWNRKFQRKSPFSRSFLLYVSSCQHGMGGFWFIGWYKETVTVLSMFAAELAKGFKLWPRPVWQEVREHRESSVGCGHCTAGFSQASPKPHDAYRNPWE